MPPLIIYHYTGPLYTNLYLGTIAIVPQLNATPHHLPLLHWSLSMLTHTLIPGYYYYSSPAQAASHHLPLHWSPSLGVYRSMRLMLHRSPGLPVASNQHLLPAPAHPAGVFVTNQV